MRVTLLILCLGAMLSACASAPAKRSGTAASSARKAGFGKGGAFVP